MFNIYPYSPASTWTNRLLIFFQNCPIRMKKEAIFVRYKEITRNWQGMWLTRRINVSSSWLCPRMTLFLPPNSGRTQNWNSWGPFLLGFACFYFGMRRLREKNNHVERGPDLAYTHHNKLEGVVSFTNEVYDIQNPTGYGQGLDSNCVALECSLYYPY